MKDDTLLWGEKEKLGKNLTRILSYQLARTRNVSLSRFDLLSSCQTTPFSFTIEATSLWTTYRAKWKLSSYTPDTFSLNEGLITRISEKRFESCHLPGYLREKRGKWRERESEKSGSDPRREFSLTNTFGWFLFNPWKNSMENGKIINHVDLISHELYMSIIGIIFFLDYYVRSLQSRKIRKYKTSNFITFKSFV